MTQTPVRARAEQGDAEAQSAMGLLYSNGRGVPQDSAEAVRLWRLAAEQGAAHAQHKLGLSYYDGDGVPQDYLQAHMWLNLSASRITGDYRYREEVVRRRDDVAARMTPEQIAEAQRIAREWDEAHPRNP